MNWTAEQLHEFKLADDLHVAPLREDGATPGTPTFIWSVVRRGSLYIRAYHGTQSRWYKAAIKRQQGEITIGGRRYLVAFEPVVDDRLNDRVDTAYRAKYALSSYVASMISSRARASTIRVMPIAKPLKRKRNLAVRTYAGAEQYARSWHNQGEFSAEPNEVASVALHPIL